MADEEFDSFHKSLEVMTDGSSSAENIKEVEQYLFTLTREYTQSFLTFSIRVINNQNESTIITKFNIILLKNFFTMILNTDKLQFRKYWKDFQSTNVPSELKANLQRLMLEVAELFDISAVTLAKIICLEDSNQEFIRNIIDTHSISLFYLINELIRINFFKNTPEKVEILSLTYQTMLQIFKLEDNFKEKSTYIVDFIKNTIEFNINLLKFCPYFFEGIDFFNEYIQSMQSISSLFDDVIVDKYCSFLSLLTKVLYPRSVEFINQIIEIIVNCPEEYLNSIISLITDILNEENRIIQRNIPSFYKMTLYESKIIIGKDNNDFIHQNICLKFEESGIFQNLLQIIESSSINDYFNSELCQLASQSLTSFMKDSPRFIELIFSQIENYFSIFNYINGMKLLGSVLNGYQSKFVEEFCLNQITSINGDIGETDFSVLKLKFHIIGKLIKKYGDKMIFENLIPYFHSFIESYDINNGQELLIYCLKAVLNVVKSISSQGKREFFTEFQEILFETRESSTFEVLELIDHIFIFLIPFCKDNNYLQELFDKYIEYMRNIDSDVENSIDKVSSSTRFVCHYFSIFCDSDVDLSIRLNEFISLTNRFTSSHDINLVENFLIIFSLLLNYLGQGMHEHIFYIFEVCKDAISMGNQRLISVSVETIGYIIEYFKEEFYTNYLVVSPEIINLFKDCTLEITTEMRSQFITGISNFICGISNLEDSFEYLNNYYRIITETIDTEIEEISFEEKKLYIETFDCIVRSLSNIIRCRTFIHSREQYLWLRKIMLKLVRDKFIKGELYDDNLILTFIHFIECCSEVFGNQIDQLLKSRVFISFYNTILYSCQSMKTQQFSYAVLIENLKLFVIE